jgi:hypothetical protein
MLVAERMQGSLMLPHGQSPRHRPVMTITAGEEMPRKAVTSLAFIDRQPDSVVVRSLAAAKGGCSPWSPCLRTHERISAVWQDFRGWWPIARA